MALCLEKFSTIEENVMTPSEQTEEEIVELKPEETKAVVGAGLGSPAAAPTAMQTMVTHMQEIIKVETDMGRDHMSHLKQH
jgi:hypothetical protein